MSHTFVAVVKGDPHPVVDNRFNLVVNGEFLISGSTSGQPVGDGVNEFTHWVFDFGKDSDYKVFDTSLPLKSARLLLTLEPRSEHVSTDSVQIKGLPRICEFLGLSVGAVSTVKVDLLQHYKSQQILDAMWGLCLPMMYEEDAIISKAELQLEQ